MRLSGGTAAHPAESFDGAVSSRPVPIGEALILLATGLGPTNPPVVTGDGSIDEAGTIAVAP